MRVGPDIETVLVDNQARTERPIRAAIGATVTLVGMDRVRRHEVQAGDHDRMLVLEESTEAPSARMVASVDRTMRRAPRAGRNNMRPAEPRTESSEPSMWMPLE